MKMSLRQYCIEHGRDTLLREWDAARNGGLTPSDVSFGSHQKVWWQCSKGHSWQAKVYSRSEGSGCPYCTGRKETPENSLAVQVPSLEAEWDAEKNAPLKFADLTIGSRRKVWWLCDKGSCVAGGRQQPHGKTALRLSDLRGQTIGPMHSNFK